jgi:hypothetical protein
MKNNYNVGKNNPAFKHGKCIKFPKCIDCGKELRNYYAVRCGICASKEAMNRPEIKKILSIKHLGKIPLNKGILKSTGKRLIETNKNTIIKHHIYLKENNDETMEMFHGEHRSLHWKGYEYLVKICLVDDYIKEFCLKYKINNLKKITSSKVRHHKDCNRDNNMENNYMYLKDKRMHNKLHQEAYRYLVKINRVIDYIDWFFLMKKENIQKSTVIEELK